LSASVPRDARGTIFTVFELPHVTWLGWERAMVS